MRGRRRALEKYYETHEPFVRPSRIGEEYGWLTIIADKTVDHKMRCRCKCGKEHLTHYFSLKSGHTGSCGCRPPDSGRPKTHGMSGTRIYNIYGGMINRCHNPKSAEAFAKYGAKGIKVCDCWRGPGGFERFLEDMGEGGKGLSLDRIDPDGNYEPSNCRWATPGQQANNKRRHKDHYRYVTWDGKRKMWQATIGLGAFEDEREAAAVTEAFIRAHRKDLPPDTRFRDDELPSCDCTIPY